MIISKGKIRPIPGGPPEALERLVSCGRSGRWGFHRAAIFRDAGQVRGAAAAPEPGSPWALARQSVETLARVPRSGYSRRPDGLSRLAKSAAARAAGQRALGLAEQAASSDPACALAWIAGALACEDLGQARGALKRLDRALALEPGEGWLYQFRGDVRRRLGDLEGFVSDCERAVLLDEGAAYFRFATGDYESRSLKTVVAAADRWLARRPEAPWMLVFRGDAKRFPELNDFDGAIRDFEAALKLDGRCSYAWAYLSRARMSKGGPGPALEAIDRALRLEPECGWYHCWRGEILRRTGKPAQALRELDLGLALDPDYEFGYAWRGGARRALGRHEEALADLDLAGTLDPSYAWTFAEKSLTLRALGKTIPALAELERACALDPKHSFCPNPDGAPEALRELDGALRAEPSHAGAWAWRGEVRLRAGDLPAARADLEKALKLEPGRAWARAWLGRVLWLSGETAAARKSLDAAVRLDPRYANSWAWRGRLRFERGDRKGALADLARAESLDPRSAWISQWKGEAAASLNLWEEALRDFTRAGELDANARRSRAWQSFVFSKLGRLDSSSAVLVPLLDQAVSLSRSGEHSAASEILSEILDVLPDHKPSLELRSEAFRCLGEHARAVADREKLAALQPGAPEPLVSLGAAKRAALDFQGALAAANRALELDPSRPSSWVLRSEALRNLGRFEAAAESARRAAEIEPSAAWPRVVRAKALRQSGNLEQALREARQAAVLAPRDAKAQAWLGEILRKSGRTREAAAALARAVALDPSIAWARALLGEVRRESGKSAEGLADLLEAVRIDGGCSCAYDLLGDEPPEVRCDPNWAWVYAWRGAIGRREEHWAQALKDLNHALTLDPACHWARAWRGELLLARGDGAGALADLQAAVAALPSYADARTWLSLAHGRGGGGAPLLEQVRRLKNASPEVRLGAAVALKEAGRLEEALAECRAVIAGGVRAAGVWELRADLEASLGMPGPAWNSLKEAIGLSPRDPGLRLKAAKALKGLGYFQEALRQAQSARKLEPSEAAVARVADLENLLGRGKWARRAVGPRPKPEISGDARVELLSAVWALAGRPQGGGFEFDPRSRYAQDLKSALKPWRKHPATRALRRALERGLSQAGAQRSMLYLSEPPELQALRPWEGSRVHGELLESLRSFARDSGFAELFAAWQRERRGWIEDVRAQRESMDFIGLMETYSGMKVRAGYAVVLAPLLPAGGGGALNHLGRDRAAGGYFVTSTIGPSDFPQGRPSFFLKPYRMAFWHELGHVLLDELLERHQAEVEVSRGLLTPASRDRYGSWEQTVREHIVQGLASRMVDWAEEAGLASGPVRRVKESFLPYIGPTAELYREYEGARKRYPNLAAFYPRVLEFFTGLAKRRRGRAEDWRPRGARAHDGLL